MLPAVLFLCSCNKEEQGYTWLQLEQKADSTVNSRIKDLRRQAREDLDRRLPIELKPKVDSLLHVSYAIQPPPQIAGSDSFEFEMPTDTGNRNRVDTARSEGK